MVAKEKKIFARTLSESSLGVQVISLGFVVRRLKFHVSLVLSKLKREYRDMEESVITMALQVCDYDETRTKNLLDRMKT